MKSVLLPFLILLISMWAWLATQVEDLLRENGQLLTALGRANEALAFTGSRLQDANEQVAEATEMMSAATAALNECRHADVEVDQ